MKVIGRASHRVVKDTICDRCGRKGSDDIMEAQEFLSHHDTGGYGSIFGDLNHIEIDLCQHCVKDILGQWLRVMPCDFACGHPIASHRNRTIVDTSGGK